MPLEKTHRASICNGLITLTRRYMGSTPDELGTIAQWEAVFWALYSAIPFPDFWRELDVVGIHMDSDVIEDETKRLIANLQDFDTGRPGYQVAAGLYWGRRNGRPYLEVAFFPAGWRPEDAPQVRPVPAAEVLRSLAVLSHEAGHFYGDMCGYYKTSTLIQRELSRLFDSLRPVQAENAHECLAEVFRAFFGAPGQRGTFSDGKPYRPADNPALYALMVCAYWLQSHLANKDFTDLQAWPEGRVLWQEWGRTWFGQRYSLGYRSLDLSWRLHRWELVAGTWQWVPA